jgi:hypothetical protein
VLRFAPPEEGPLRPSPIPYPAGFSSSGPFQGTRSGITQRMTRADTIPGPATVPEPAPEPAPEPGPEGPPDPGPVPVPEPSPPLIPEPTPQ